MNHTGKKFWFVFTPPSNSAHRYKLSELYHKCTVPELVCMARGDGDDVVGVFPEDAESEAESLARDVFEEWRKKRDARGVVYPGSVVHEAAEAAEALADAIRSGSGYISTDVDVAIDRVRAAAAAARQYGLTC